MKLKFKIQQYQTDAVNVVVDLFRGQEKQSTTFTLAQDDTQMTMLENEIGVGNALLISDDIMLANIRELQRCNRLETTSN